MPRENLGANATASSITWACRAWAHFGSSLVLLFQFMCTPKGLQEHAEKFLHLRKMCVASMFSCLQPAILFTRFTVSVVMLLDISSLHLLLGF